MMRDTKYGGSFEKPDWGKAPYWAALFVSASLALGAAITNKRPQVMSKVHTTEFDSDYTQKERDELTAIAGGKQ